MQFCLRPLYLVLNPIVSVELIQYPPVIELFGKVGVFKCFKTEGSRRRLKSEVNKSKLGLCVSNCVAINSYH